MVLDGKLKGPTVFGLLLITTVLTGSVGADPSRAQAIYRETEWPSHELCHRAFIPRTCGSGCMPAFGAIRLIADTDSGDSLEAKAAATLAWSLRSWSGPNDQALAWLDRAYAESIDHYGKLTVKAKVMEAKKRFAERWPVRAYVSRAHSSTVECDRDSEQCIVTSIIDWDCRSEARGARATGSANLTLKVQLMRDRGAIPVMRITGENSSVISRVSGQ